MNPAFAIYSSRLPEFVVIIPSRSAFSHVRDGGNGGIRSDIGDPDRNC